MTRAGMARALALLWPLAAFAQSEHALRFYGTGVGPPGQQDRVKIRIDNPAAVLDVGDDFTIEFWMRAAASNNNGTVAAASHGDGWITGNILVDRDIYGSGDFGDFGIAIGGSGTQRFVAFGADVGGSGLTIVGTNHVANNAWQHVAVTRVRSNGQMRIYVNARLDAQGAGPTGDMSYRNNRATGFTNSDPFLVLAAEKHDAGAAYPSFNGYLDEFRVWTQALSPAALSNVFNRIVPTNAPALVACYRFEEGAGTNVFDATARSPAGRLIAGVAGNGEWVSRSVHTNHTAPLLPYDGDTDRDGMPDAWEIAHQLDFLSAGDAEADADGDTMRNLDEYIAGTSPTNAADFQRLEIRPPESSNDWKIVFPTATGRLYLVEFAINLAEGIWAPHGAESAGSGSEFSLTPTNVDPSGFYRNRVRLAP